MCAWHIEQKLKKKVFYLNKGKNEEAKSLYKTITSLPYCEYNDAFLENQTKILKSKVLSENFIDYFKEVIKSKKLWVKSYVKSYFTCGTVTSSRIESKHRVLKEYLNGNSRLGEVYACFKELEESEIKTFLEEEDKISRRQSASLDKHDLINKAKDIYSDYVIQILKGHIFQAIHYNVKTENNYW